MKYIGFIIAIFLIIACNGNKKEQQKTSNVGIILNTDDLEFYSDENLEKIRNEFHQKLNIIENINDNETIHNEIKILWEKIWIFLENDSKLPQIWFLESDIKMLDKVMTSEQQYNAIDYDLKYHFGLNYEEAKRLEKDFMDNFYLSWDELGRIKSIAYRKYNRIFPDEEDMKLTFWKRYKWE